MTPYQYIKKLEARYKKNSIGVVERPAMRVNAIDPVKGVMTLTPSKNALIWSQEIEDIHWLIRQLKYLHTK